MHATKMERNAGHPGLCLHLCRTLAGRNWQACLAPAWLSEDPEISATLSVEGHVDVYSGRKGRLPKHFASRQELSLSASTRNPINALGGRPILCQNLALPGPP